MKRSTIYSALFLSTVVTSLALGGAAQATTYCVNPGGTGGCSPTIQAVVGPALPGDIISVAAGTYNEQVTVTTSDLYIFGAQAGNDATKGRGDSKKESTVGWGSGAFVVNAVADRVIIDGFTVQGADEGQWGITVNGDGVKILNNIIQKNSVAPCPSGCGGGLTTQSGTSGLIVQRNFFRNENDGIFATNTSNVIVTENRFSGHVPLNPAGDAAAINFNSNSSNVTVSFNDADNNQTLIVIGPNTTNVEFSHNEGKGFTGSAVYVTGANDHLTITDNVLENGQFRAIKLNQDFGAGTIQHATISYNTIKNMSTYGIFVQNPSDTGSGVPTLLNSVILGNRVDGSGIDGIFVDAGNLSNLLSQNAVSGSKGFDCHDASSGGGTLGTANTWFTNTGKKSSPAGLCK